MVAAAHPLDVHGRQVPKAHDAWNHLEARLHQRLEQRRNDEFGAHFQPGELALLPIGRVLPVKALVLGQDGPPATSPRNARHAALMASGLVAEELDRVERCRPRLVHAAQRRRTGGRGDAECGEGHRRGARGQRSEGREHQRRRVAVVAVNAQCRVMPPSHTLGNALARQRLVWMHEEAPDALLMRDGGQSAEKVIDERARRRVRHPLEVGPEPGGASPEIEVGHEHHRRQVLRHCFQGLDRRHDRDEVSP